MSDPAPLASLFDDAERAALAGDYAAAARSLGEAAHAQEAALGPDHLDLANTLNNLAVAHERCGQLEAAEREYRRAHAIAARTLPADDPIVVTSAENLREFCAANGRPFEPAAETVPDPAVPDPAALDPAGPDRTVSDRNLGLALAADAGAPAVSVAAPASQPAAPGVVEHPRLTLAEEPAPPPAMHAMASATPASAAPMAPAPGGAPPSSGVTPAPAPTRVTPAPAQVTPAPARAAAARVEAAPRPAPAALVLWLLAGRGPAAPPAAPQAAAPEGVPSPTPPAASTSPTPPPAARPAPAPAPAAAAPAATTAAADGLTIGEADVCVALSPGYRCDPAGETVAAGRLVFYTKLIAPRDTSVVHRWYRGDELRQSVRLDIPARRQGFRTFSRTTVAAGSGDWRVELRSRDGRLLHTERFSVR
jgi:hypothetical protein